MTETTQDKKTGTIPFYPDHLKTEIRVVWILVGLAFLVGALTLFSPVGLEEPADPMVTPEHVKPEWYFLGLYQLLKYIPKTVGVLLPIIGLIVVFIWPFLDKKADSSKQRRVRIIGSAVFMVILIALTIWGWFS
jgi:quinol-cytochrome oxidoreductase complex cytochrome b subunit